MNALFEIPALERMPKKDIEKEQIKKLKRLLSYVEKKSPFYKNHFKKYEVNIETITSISDLKAIPPVEKIHLQKKNESFFCIKKEEARDVVSSSGTTGEAIFSFLSEKDLERLAYNEAISLACAQGSPNDFYQLTTTIDRRFMAGLAYFLGIRKLNCGVVRVGSGASQLQLDTIQRLKPNVLIAVPSFAYSLVKYAQKVNFDLNTSSLKKIICIGEAIRDVDLKPNALQNKIKSLWDIELYSTYASTEMGTAYTECQHQKGGHEHPELIISELLSENNEVITNENEIGELCITTLGVEGMPLVRFKTGDMVRFYTEKCLCGRNTKRISPVVGRKNQMIKYKGTTIYPNSIFEILNGFNQVKNYVVELTTNEINTDEIEVFVSYHNAEKEAINIELLEVLRSKLRVKPKLKVCSDQIVLGMQEAFNPRKPQKLIDKRKN